MDTEVPYRPGSGDKTPFALAKLDLCGAKCHRANASVSLRLQATPTQLVGPHEAHGGSPGGQHEAQQHAGSFHCDRHSYSMVSKRRMCG